MHHVLGKAVQGREVYIFSVPDGTWSAAVDAQSTRQATGPASSSSETSMSVEEVPKHQEVAWGKQPVSKEPAKKKRKTKPPPTTKPMFTYPKSKLWHYAKKKISSHIKLTVHVWSTEC
jgi:hypothetical protein